jgi:hypothetical protein
MQHRFHRRTLCALVWVAAALLLCAQALGPVAAAAMNPCTMSASGDAPMLSPALCKAACTAQSSLIPSTSSATFTQDMPAGGAPPYLASPLTPRRGASQGHRQIELLRHAGAPPVNILYCRFLD